MDLNCGGMGPGGRGFPWTPFMIPEGGTMLLDWGTIDWSLSRAVPDEAGPSPSPVPVPLDLFSELPPSRQLFTSEGR